MSRNLLTLEGRPLPGVGSTVRNHTAGFGQSDISLPDTFKYTFANLVQVIDEFTEWRCRFGTIGKFNLANGEGRIYEPLLGIGLDHDPIEIHRKDRSWNRANCKTKPR